MNTDITASAKPEYPVIDRNPPFTKTVANFNTLDYLRLITISGVSFTAGYLSGFKPNIRCPSMVTGGLIGVMGGFMYAYQNSAGRLMGFFPNDGEVVNEIHNTTTEKNKEWQDKLPIVVLKAEEIMYSKANSEAEYMDLTNLWDRANDAINTIIRRDESTETGVFLQPCIEGVVSTLI